MNTTRRIALVALAVFWAVSVQPVRAQDSEKAFYAGKTVRMIVGSGVGGGYDVFSRLIAPYLAKTLGATVIVDNVPGAGGLVALNKLYIAPPDLWLVGPDSPIREVQQAVDAKMKWRWASAGGTSGLGIGAAFTCEALKLDCHIVQGYKSSADAGLAVTRGEMDAVYVPESSANHFVKSKQNWALATISRTKSQFFRDRPTVFEAAKIDSDRLWAMDYLANLEGLGRLLMAPPGIPPARLAYLLAAVKETLHNPQLIAEGEKMERIIEYLDPASTHKNVVSVVSGISPEQKARVLKLLAGEK